VPRGPGARAVAAAVSTTVLAVLVALLMPGGPAEPRPREIRVVEYNLCGAAAACPWNAGRHGSGTSVERLVREVTAFRPDLVMLNEVCLSQYARVRKDLARAGWAMDGTYASSLNEVPACGTPGAFGSAVLSREDVPDDRRDHRPFRNTGGETYPGNGRTVPVGRGLLCAHTRFADAPLVACTAHTFSKEPRQLREIADRLAEFPEHLPVVLAGDLNLPPSAPALSWLTDRLVEADAGRKATADGRKIDYVFASRHHFEARGTDVEKHPESDHALLEARFTAR
jgi:endonuclease/exonuclease/phosphatase family metal-dependent hydrolase